MKEIMEYMVSIFNQDQEFQKRVIIYCKMYSLYLRLNKIETMIERGHQKSFIKFNKAPLVFYFPSFSKTNKQKTKTSKQTNLWHHLPLITVLNPVSWPSSYCSLLSMDKTNPFILVFLDISMMFVINHQLFLSSPRKKQADHKFFQTPWVLLDLSHCLFMGN